MDSVERSRDLNDILMPHRNNFVLIETPEGGAGRQIIEAS